eukprot:10948182-Lingulodinium_polyedra.AAC.1
MSRGGRPSNLPLPGLGVRENVHLCQGTCKQARRHCCRASYTVRCAVRHLECPVGSSSPLVES